METRDLFVTFLPVFLVRSGFAVLCGAIIGIERERKGKPAGFRTNTLICFGSSLYMLVTEFILRSTGGAQVDPTRIAAQVVTGIGFLGAGTIIQSRGTITGLTSAATIWVVAGIGILVGAGFPILGLIGSLMTLGTLVLLHRIEPRLLGKCHFVGCTVIFTNDGGRTRAEIASLLTENDFEMSQVNIEKVDNLTSKLHLNFCDKHPAHHRFLSELWRTPGIIEITKDPNGPAG